MISTIFKYLALTILSSQLLTTPAFANNPVEYDVKLELYVLNIFNKETGFLLYKQFVGTQVQQAKPNKVDINNDGYQDLIIELIGTKGFEPLVFINEKNTALHSLPLSPPIYIDYSQLKSNTPGKLITAYNVVENGIIFSKAFVRKKLVSQLKCNVERLSLNCD